MTMEVEIEGGDWSEAAAKSRNAKDSWQPPEKLERQRKIYFSLELSERAWHFDFFELPAYLTVRE